MYYFVHWKSPRGRSVAYNKHLLHERITARLDQEFVSPKQSQIEVLNQLEFSQQQ